MPKIKKPTSSEKHFRLSFESSNYVIFGIGILTIIVGYFIMATGETYSIQSLTIAPIVLLLGYLVIIPFSLLYKSKRQR